MSYENALFPTYMYQNSHSSPRLKEQTSVSGLVFFVFKSALGKKIDCKRIFRSESLGVNLIYGRWAIENRVILVFSISHQRTKSNELTW